MPRSSRFLSVTPQRFYSAGWLTKEPVRRLELRSGDVIWFGGPSRPIFHDLEGIKFGSSRIIKESGCRGRWNLTLRRINRAQIARGGELESAT
jgi:DNA oxidative demethylase